MPAHKSHYYLAAAMLTYAREDATKTRYMNLVFEGSDKKVTAGTLNNGRNALISRLCQEAQITPDAVKDIVFVSLTYMGHMSEKEFQDMEEPSRSTREPNPFDS